MEKREKEEEYIRKFITELGTESPSKGFHKSVLSKLNPGTSRSIYRPVISPFMWKLIGGAIATLVISVLLFVPNDNQNPLINQIPEFSLPEVAVSLPKIALPVIDISPIVLQSLVVFTLMAFLMVVTKIRKWRILG
ncbi:hypothetical protein SAMN04489724_1478 [Algoriphagus locisalis]|uniref:Uncharacterized protein n=1 Tax=Algoriphagus locisalis TaxID=305507 RepID=A0A1I6ZUN9_9BACT|nr:hypothetical protein [Algoriphagus locisalis]SFT66373.1 hypothetical protein SAMN04489724_1478 [Algoriphagus locisalis]